MNHLLTAADFRILVSGLPVQLANGDKLALQDIGFAKMHDILMVEAGVRPLATLHPDDEFPPDMQPAVDAINQFMNGPFLDEINGPGWRDNLPDKKAT